MPPFIPKRCIIPGPWEKLYKFGPVLDVVVRVPSVVAQLSNGPQEARTVALVDTGATITAISADIATVLGLQAADKVPIQGAHGLQNCNVYSIDFTFDGSGFWIPNKWVCEMAAPVAGPIGMLVGRDILRNAYFTYDGHTGECTIDIPSLSHPSHPGNGNPIPIAPMPILISPKQKEMRRNKRNQQKASRKKNR